MSKRSPFRPAILLLCLMLGACGDKPPAAEAPVADAAPEPIDPETLEVDPPVAEDLPGPDVAEWQPPEEPVPRARWRDALAESEAALAAGRLLADDEADGALDGFLAVLLADPDHAAARDGVARATDALAVQIAEHLRQGHLIEAERSRRALARTRPDHPQLPALTASADAARAAAELVRRAQAHAAAGRALAPKGRNALESLQQALERSPGFVPAQDALAKLETDRVNRALGAAQLQDYDGAERLLDEARRVRPGSSAAQDMGVRIVELREARAESLLAQGNAAVDALDLELASRRLEEARQVSLQGRGLDALAARIEQARHYGRHAPGQVFRDPFAGGGEGPEMVVIPHGSFRMGSPPGEPHRQDHEGPAFEVRFARGFALARNETTVAEFRRFVEATGYRSVASRRGASTVYDERGGAMVEHRGVDWQRDYAGRPAAAELPVVHIAFEDAEAYAAWLSAQTGERYSLPSEAEFEYALRAGSDTAFPWGSGPPGRVLANLTGDGDRSRSGRRWSNAIRGYDDGHWGPAPVRSYPPEGFGTFDLIGNVSEWVLDCWHDSYRRAPTDGSAWVNAGCPDRVVRGASWASSLDRARSAYRQQAAVGITHSRLGFRVRREI